MRKRSEYFELTLLVAGFGLAWLFKTIFEGLFYSTIIKFLESRFGLMEADVIAKFSAIAVPSAASFVVIWAIYRFIEKNLRQEFALVSVRKHFESFESFVIQSGDLIREGHHDVDGEEPRTLRPQQIAISE